MPPQDHPHASAIGGVSIIEEREAVTRNLPGQQCAGPGHNGGPPLIPPPRPRGRPSKSTSELRERILDGLIEGKPIRRICCTPDMPSSETIRCWRRADPEFARQFAFAQQAGWEWLAEDLVAQVEEVLRTGSAARARLIFNTGRRILARQAPRFFGGGW
jgi:hypothetical protein